MLDVSLINSGKLSLHPEQTDLSVIVHDVVEQLSDQARVSGSRISIKGENSIAGFWDRNRIEQALVNLLSNALKYGAEKPVEISVEKIGDDAQVSVRDEGMGIAPKDLGRIFGQFERAVSYENISGFGLGLYVARQIVEEHGGKIDVQSEEGVGSVFHIRLPLNDAAARAVPQAEIS
jgi:signal transduction histidine kinase